MDFYITKDYEELSVAAANFLAGQITLKPNSVLGLPTGGTPLGMYKNIVAMYQKGHIDFEKIVTFNLDEYLGLNPQHPQSYSYYMATNLFDHVNIDRNNIFIPDGKTQNPIETCKDFDRTMAKFGSIDLMILGIGANGHIGFNEPGETLQVNTHVGDLSPETIDANSRFFTDKEEVPQKAITMGLGPIMKAKRVLLLASGSSKASAIKDAFNGKITTGLPASLLQLHCNLTVILDQEAATLL